MIKIDVDNPRECIKCFCCDTEKGECNILHSQIPLQNKLKDCPIKSIDETRILRLDDSTYGSEQLYICEKCNNIVKEPQLYVYAGKLISPKYCDACGSLFKEVTRCYYHKTTKHFHRFPYGPTSSDCTDTYCILPTHGPFTLSDLLVDILEDIGVEEWGDVVIKDTEYKIEYKHGKIISENMPEDTQASRELLNKNVVGVTAYGGYSNMDYYVTLED